MQWRILVGNVKASGRRAFSAVAALCALAAIGCSSADYGHVTGTVKIDGQPVEGVEVRLAPDNGRAAWGVTDAQGKYELNYTPGVKGAKTGPNTVYLSTAKEAEVDDAGKISKPALPEKFPAEYNAAPTHKVDVKPGENVFDFDVPGKK